MASASAQVHGWDTFALRSGAVSCDVRVRRGGRTWIALVILEEEPSLGVADTQPAAIWMALAPCGAEREALFLSLPRALGPRHWIRLLGQQQPQA